MQPSTVKVFFVCNIIGVFMRKILILFFCVLSLGAMDLERDWEMRDVEGLHIHGLMEAKANRERRKLEDLHCFSSFLPHLSTDGFSAYQLAIFNRANAAVWSRKWKEASVYLVNLVESQLPHEIAPIVEFECIKACLKVDYEMDFNSHLMRIFAGLKSVELREGWPLSWSISINDVLYQLKEVQK